MKTHKEILISIDEFETRVGILENRQLVEFYSEQIDKHRIAGNIYKGRIKDVVPGMEASFVDIGLERNAFLYVDEVIVTDAELKTGSTKIQHLLEPGQELMVQVKRDPVDTKGARVTTQIALAGRKLVLLPLNRLIGVSKRLEEEERDRLQRLAEQVCPEGIGVIIRTAAQDAKATDLAADIELLQANWQDIQKKAGKVDTPSGLSTELDLSGRVVRDMFSADYDHILIDSKEKKDEITELVKRMSPELVGRIKHYRGQNALFVKHNIESQLKTALKRKVWLRSGGYIAIDKIEALTGIDVNTAKYTGGKDLEHTIYKTNLEAADEIMRQIRLRDIGGIIVMDFIDMK
ncbi:MAG: Rne/Rng family ribonuclease, partial [Actinomycetia bacterium]|nr:Rne/Rng family ribonuclease [Actinomycetes bacterium]